MGNWLIVVDSFNHSVRISNDLWAYPLGVHEEIWGYYQTEEHARRHLPNVQARFVKKVA